MHSQTNYLLINMKLHILEKQNMFLHGFWFAYSTWSFIYIYQIITYGRYMASWFRIFFSGAKLQPSHASCQYFFYHICVMPIVEISKVFFYQAISLKHMTKYIIGIKIYISMNKNKIRKEIECFQFSSWSQTCGCRCHNGRVENTSISSSDFW